MQASSWIANATLYSASTYVVSILNPCAFSAFSTAYSRSAFNAIAPELLQIVPINHTVSEEPDEESSSVNYVIMLIFGQQASSSPLFVDILNFGQPLITDLSAKRMLYLYLTNN